MQSTTQRFTNEVSPEYLRSLDQLVCVALGFNGVGKSLCTGIGIGAGAWGGIELGGWGDEKTGTLIYEGDFI